MAQWQDYVGAIDPKWSDDDEALVDSLVVPGHPSTPATTTRSNPFLRREP
jgi:hypothetical protein